MTLWLKKQMISCWSFDRLRWVLLENTQAETESLLHNLEQAAGGIGLHVNANKTEYTYFKQEGAISIQSQRPPKLVDKFMYLSSNISSTESDVSIIEVLYCGSCYMTSGIAAVQKTCFWAREFCKISASSKTNFGCNTHSTRLIKFVGLYHFS